MRVAVFNKKKKIKKEDTSTIRMQARYNLYDPNLKSHELSYEVRFRARKHS